MESSRRWPLYLIAFLSGIPALLSQVVWTRQIALTAGSESEAMGLVVAIFFSGLALGSAALGRFADAVRMPLRWYGTLELAVGVVLAGSAALSLGAALADLTETIGLGRRLGAVLPILPATFLMGGTLPALLRHAASLAADSSGARADEGARSDAGIDAGRLVALNTAGAVAGVCLAMFSIPAYGLKSSLLSAGLLSLGIGAAAVLFVQRGLRVALESRRPETLDEPRNARSISRRTPLVLAGLAGMATLSFEVALGRSASLALGSSLYAWGTVLILTLFSLALGNAIGSAQLARVGDEGLSRRVATQLFLAAASMLLAPTLLGHHPADPARGLNLLTFARTACAVVPAMTLMGMVFPFLAKLGVRETDRGRDFGWVSGINTAGGVVGSIAASFWAIPLLGSIEAFGFCAGIAGIVAAIVARSSPEPLAQRPLVGGLFAVAAAIAIHSLDGPDERLRADVLSIDHGPRATTVVRRSNRSRELIIDGEPEASTYGRARRTEELLAVLPFVMHPNPVRFLELGLGSGITFATAARFGPEQLDCVEIAPSVIRAQRFFAPDNQIEDVEGNVSVGIVVGDARSHLRSVEAAYDVIVANTAQPWSLQATGLYSVEYYERIHRALRGGGLVAQWLPNERISRESLAEILQTFFRVFEHGSLYWGEGSLFLLGSETPLPIPTAAQIAERLRTSGFSTRELGLSGPDEVLRRRIAGAKSIRHLLTDTAILTDDHPRLEARRASGKLSDPVPGALALLHEFAQFERQQDPSRRPIALFIESLRLRELGDLENANRIEASLLSEGLLLGETERRERNFRSIGEALLDSRRTEARKILDGFSASDREDGRYSMARALIALDRGDDAFAERALRLASENDPRDPVAPSMLGELLAKRNTQAALAAFSEALRRDPFSVRALAASGLLLLAEGDVQAAGNRLHRLQAISPLGERPEAAALEKALLAHSVGPRTD